MMTGTKPIDITVPIGCGQRELTTAIAIDTVFNQKKWNNDKGVEKSHHAYIAIGQKRSIVAQLIQTFEANDIAK